MAASRAFGVVRHWLIAFAALGACAVLVRISHAQETPAGVVWLMGDVNCDEEIDSTDAERVLQFQAGLIPPLPCKENARVDGDFHVTSVDAQLILQYEAGLIDHLPPIRTFVGTVVLAQGVEADCVALQTDNELFVLWEPADLVPGQRVRVNGFIDPWVFFICGVGRVLNNVSVEELD